MNTDNEQKEVYRDWRTFKNKVSRFFSIYLFPERTRSGLSKRSGECARCGRCCKLIIRCPMLRMKNNMAECKIYNYRSTVCRLFPINNEDLKDVEFQCGHKFND